MPERGCSVPEQEVEPVVVFGITPQVFGGKSEINDRPHRHSKPAISVQSEDERKSA